jgi:hypothetical protein
MMASRTVLVALSLGLLVSACSSDRTSLTDYVEQINAVSGQASRRGAELQAQADQMNDLTPQDVQRGLEEARAIRIEIKEATDAIEPPEQVADLHNLIFDWHTKFIGIEEALATRAGAATDTVQGWTDLSASPEMAAYRQAIAEGKQVCLDYQAQLDATAARGAFADTPWVPSEMKEVVDAVLGCEWFPDNPDDVYRYPPPGED